MLLFKFKDGSTRVMHPNTEFFKDALKKGLNETLYATAADFGEPYSVEAHHPKLHGGTYKTVWPKNANAFIPEEKKVDEVEIKKQLRKQFKNSPFTIKQVM